MRKPPIPSIENEEAVIDWFIEHDNKIKDYFDPPPPFILNLAEQLKEEMLANLKEYHDAQSLEGFVKKIANFYTMKLLPDLAAKHDANQEIPVQFIYMEISLATKMRVLGYFLLKKYGIQTN